ncbi:MAG: L-seryl-tRNA(Sec) selenium transferase [Planctomycetes bacterium]|nr:L-seryl-tRNA(Sec) selenium transferase [Planctomycetota bacterium]
MSETSRPEGPAAPSLLSRIPAVDRLLERPEAAAILGSFDRSLVVGEIRALLDELRQGIREGDVPEKDLAARIESTAILAELRRRVEALAAPRVRRVINATGVVLHTGLGRAVLAPSALERVRREVGGYSYVEIDPESGNRGERELAVRDLLCRLTGAQNASVVNNNAGAVLLALAAIARGKEVVVSRGQLVEIGGSFRIPDVMAESGARLVEVGTTNRTRLSDYERAIGPQTGALLAVHPSNYRIVGFTEAVPTQELVKLGSRHGLPVIEDLGSGAFLDYSPYGLEGEPTVREVVASGVALATFSGDKLLGGPQSGIVVGRSDEVAKVRRHPLYRALRLDKIVLAALEATLGTYLDTKSLARTNPTFRMLTEPAESIRPRADALAARLVTLAGLSAEVRPDVSRPGSGSLPTTEIPTFVVAVHAKDLAAHELARRLRTGVPAVVPRVQEDLVLLDPRTVLPGEEEDLFEAFRRATAAGG